MSPKKIEFNNGETVVYPKHGVGEIIKIESMEIANIKTMFYVVKMEQSKLTIRVPIEKKDEVGLRRISSKKIINEVFNLNIDYSDLMNLEFDNNLKIKELNENKIVIETFSEKDSILILTDVFYPGWEVFVDGEQTEIHRANGVVRAVVLEEGSHSVEFNYVPKSCWFGVIISIITLIILAGLYAYSQKYYKNNESKK